MKNFHQNLLIVLALGLCLLCAWQWRNQTQQRNRIEGLGQEINRDALTIQEKTNSIATMQQQINQMDAQITGLKDEAATNNALILTQRRELNKLEAESDGLTNQVTQYKQAVDTLEARLKSAYDGISKQNDAIMELTSQRDDFVQKLNDSVKDRNEVVKKYNELVAQWEKLQGGGAKATNK
jgi:chromosome segregation ATPase